MSPSTRPPVPHVPDESDGGPRETLVDRLLVAGLDLYFAGDYERAIHTWTRVLFIDRGHARARAYIDRARRVLNERQREVEELAHTGIEALESGDQRTARTLLAAAYDRDHADERTLLALERLDRLEAAGTAPAPAAERPAGLDAAVAPVRRTRNDGARASRALAIAAAVFLVAAAGVVLTWDRVAPLRPGARPRSAEVSAAVAQPAALPLPSPADLVLARARALGARGHLREALRLAESIGPGDQRRPEADQLRAEIERTLIAAASTTAAVAAAAPAPSIAPPPPLRP